MKLKKIYILFTFVIIFFMIYCYLPLTVPPKFTSPDENTNYFFIKLYAETGAPSYSEELNKIAEGIIRPRNTLYVNDNVVPAGFLGIYIIYGTIYLFLENLILYLTPLLAAVGIILFYYLIKENFSRKIALVSSLLLCILPPYWYWNSMTMFNDVPALVFFIGGLLYFFRSLKYQYLNYYLISTTFFALSFMIRLTYFYSAIPLLLLLFIKRRNINLKFSLYSILWFCILFSPILLLNKMLYGGYFTISYFILAQNIKQLSLNPPITSLSWIIPNFKNYFIDLFPVITLIGLLGLLLSFKKEYRSNYKLYFLLSSLILLINFGQGVPVSDSPTIHDSYTRYILLVYVLLLPFLAHFLYSLRGRRVAVLVLTSVLIISSVSSIYSEQSNIPSIQRTVVNYDNLNNYITYNTESNSIILVSGCDKIFFPDRRVAIVWLIHPEEKREEKLANITDQLMGREIPVYIYKEVSMDDVGNSAYEVLSWSRYEEKLRDLDYSLKKIHSKYRLYKVIRGD